jgi:hypothetical protein
MEYLHIQKHLKGKSSTSHLGGMTKSIYFLQMEYRGAYLKDMQQKDIFSITPSWAKNTATIKMNA